MPTVPVIPPADRVFARVQVFQCACPSCGRLLTSNQDQGHLAQHLSARGETPPSHQYRKRARTVKSAETLVWNQYNQRLTCPWCRCVFVVGLLIYPVTPGSPRNAEAPVDCVPTVRERQELARRDRIEQARGAGGWYLEEPYVAPEPVNRYVPAACRCPRRGWVSDCPVHGSPPATAGGLP